MPNGCNNVTHRAIESVLVYLNAFLILDFARLRFGNNPGLAVVIMIIVTFVTFYILQNRCTSPPKDDNGIIPSTMILPVPNSPVETFRPRRSMIAF